MIKFHFRLVANALLIILILLGITLCSHLASAEEEVKFLPVLKSSQMTARFSSIHSCSVEHIGNNLLITATHCIDYIFIRNFGNLNVIEIDRKQGLFKVVYYTLDRGVTLTDGFAIIQVFMLDLSDRESLSVSTVYTPPTELHCYPALSSGLIVEVKSKLIRPTKLSKTRVMAVGSIGAGCSGGAWLNSEGLLIGITSAGWGGSGVGSAVIVTNHTKLINKIINGHRPKLLSWKKAKKAYRKGELKRRKKENDRKNRGRNSGIIQPLPKTKGE